MLAVAGLMGGAATPADACTCGPGSTLENRKEAATVVFEGQAVAIGKGTFFKQAARFEVLRAWKGIDPGTTITVQTNGAGGPCGVPVVLQRVMLVFAGKWVKKKRSVWAMGLCGGSRPSDHALKEITALGPPLPMRGDDPQPSGGSSGAQTGGGGGAAAISPKEPRELRDESAAGRNGRRR